MSDELVVKMVPLSEVTPNPDNPRVNSSAVSAVAESIRLFGFKVPLVLGKDRMILAGHTRYRAAVNLGLTEVPCVDASELSEEEAAAFAVAENRTSDFAFFDVARLSDFVADVPEDLLEAFDVDAVLHGTQNDDEAVEKVLAESRGEKREGLDLAPFEKYQYVMVLCRTEFDYLNLLSWLKLENPQKAYIDGVLKRGSSYGRVIEYADFRERVREG